MVAGRANGNFSAERRAAIRAKSFGGQPHRQHQRGPADLAETGVGPDRRTTGRTGALPDRGHDCSAAMRAEDRPGLDRLTALRANGAGERAGDRGPTLGAKASAGTKRGPASTADQHRGQRIPVGRQRSPALLAKACPGAIVGTTLRTNAHLILTISTTDYNLSPG